MRETENGAGDKMLEELRMKGYGEWKGACEIKIKCFLCAQQVSSKGGWIGIQGDILDTTHLCFIFNLQCTLLNISGAPSEVTSAITHNLLYKLNLEHNEIRN